MQNVLDHETLIAARSVGAVLREAEYMAALTAAFLKEVGYRPQCKRGAPPTEEAEDRESSAQAKGFLLNLAAAIRIAHWERTGLLPRIDCDLPHSATAFQKLVPQVDEMSMGGRSGIMPKLAQAVFKSWAKQFAPDGRAELGVDVLLPGQAPSMEDLLDALADFLLANGHLADAKEG